MRKSFKKTISVALSIAMVATSVDLSPKVVRADVNQTEGTEMDLDRYVLESGTYYMSSNLNYAASGSDQRNGLVIAENADVVIYLNGYTLSATGSNAKNGSNGSNGGTPDRDDDGDRQDGGAGGTGGAGGYAGIKLPSSSTLTFVGVGTVNATGGSAGAGGAGGTGGAGILYDGTGTSNNYCSPGSGGGGGGAGGGAGAGIGTDGTAGTNGTTGGHANCKKIDDGDIDWSNCNYASASLASANSAGAGKLYVYNDYSGAITINANGGSAYSTQSSSGSYGPSMNDAGTGWSKYFTSTGGAGGASGGGGGAANSIGSGGTGGTGGVGGASGAYYSYTGSYRYRYGHGGGAGKGGNNVGVTGINGGEPTSSNISHFNGSMVNAANSGSRAAVDSDICTNLYLRGVYAFDKSEKTYKVGDFISKNEITAYEVYSTNKDAVFDGTKPLNTYYDNNMSAYNSEINTNGWFTKSITAADYTIIDAEETGDNAGKLEITEDLIKSITKTETAEVPTGAVKIKLRNVDEEKAVSEGFVSDIDIDMDAQQTAFDINESEQAELGDYPTEGEAAAYNEKVAINTVTYDGKGHSLAELIKNTGYGYSNGEDSTNAITDDFFKKGLESSTEKTDNTYWYSDYAMAPYYCVKYEPYKTFDQFAAENYLTGTSEGEIIEGMKTKTPYFTRDVINDEIFLNAGYYSVTVVVPYKYFTYRYASSWEEVHYYYRLYTFNLLIRQADLAIDKAGDTVYENTKVQNHTFTRNVEGQNEEVFGEFVYSSATQSWGNNESRSANVATPLIEDITWEFNVYYSKDQNNYLCQFDGPHTEDDLNTYYSKNNGTLLFTEGTVANRTIDMDVNVYYQDEQSEEGKVTAKEDLKKQVITSEDEEKVVKSVYAENIGVEAKLNRNDTSLGFRVLEGDAVTGDTTLGTKIDETTLPSQYQGYFDDLVEDGKYKGDYYVITIKAGEKVIISLGITDNSEKSYSELIKQVTDILPACEFFGVESYDVTIDYIGLYYTTETSAAGRLPDWNGEEEFNWVSSQVNFKVDVDQRDISIKELSDIDKVYDGTDYIVSQTLSEQGDVTNAAGYVVDVATINATDTQFKKKGTTTFFNYYDVSYDSSNAMKLEMSGTYDDKNKGQNKVATVNSAKIFAAGENNSYLNYKLINIPTTVSGDVSVANMYFNHNLYGTMEVQDSTPLHEIYGITSKAYLLHTELDENGYIVPAATTLDELVEKNDVKTASAAFTTNEEEYDYDTTYKLVDNRYSPDVLGIDSNTGEITEVAIATKGGTNPSQFPSAIITIADYSNFTLIKPDEHVEVGTYGECEISENKNNLTYSDEATSHEMRYRIIGNENTYDVFLPVNQINNGGFDSKYIDKYVSFVKNGEERFDYLTVYEEGDGASFKFTVPQNSYLEDLYLVDLGEYKSYLQDDIKTFKEMQALIGTEDALGSFNTQTETLNANDNPLYLKLDAINDVEATSIPEGNAQVGGSTFKFTITTGNSVLGNNKSIAIVPVFKEYNLLNDEYKANLTVESTLDAESGDVVAGDDDFVYVNYKTDFDTDAYDEAGYGLINLEYKDTEEVAYSATSELTAQTFGEYSIGMYAESDAYKNFFVADKLIPGTVVDVTVKVWRDGVTEKLNDLTTADPDAFDEVTFKWTVTEEDYHKLFDDDSVIFRKDNSVEGLDNITAYAYYNDAEAFTFGKVAVMVEKQEDNTWKVVTDVNMLDVADTWYVADGVEGTRIVISDDAQGNYPVKSVGGEVKNNVPYGTSLYPTYETVKVSEIDTTSVDEKDWTVKDLGYARLVFGKVNPCGKMIFAEKEEDIAKVLPYAEATYEYETSFEKTQPYTFEGWEAKDKDAEEATAITDAVELANGANLYAKKKIYFAEFYALEDLVAYGVYDGKADTVDLSQMPITEEKPESGKECVCTVTDMNQFHVDLFKNGDWYYDEEMTTPVEDLTAAQVVVTEEQPVAKFYLATQKVEEIQAEDIEVLIGDETNVEYTVLPEDAYDKSVIFESTDDTIATVDEEGKVVAVGIGTTTIKITAIDVGEVVKEINVVVKPVLIDRITLVDQTLFLGDSVELVATIEPENATDKSVTWASSDEKIAKVDENGKVTTVGCGTVTITATAVDEGKVVGTATVVVKPILVGKITLKDQSLFVGESAELAATIEPENATNKSVTWTSSDEKVATVDSTGKVTAVAFGKAVITAKAIDDGKVIGTANISVWDKDPTKEEIYANNIEINKEYAVRPTKKGLAVKWNKVEDAEGYDVFVSSCSKKFAKGEIINVGKDVTKIKVNKIKGKKMNLKKNYKVLVKAYRTINGKKTYIAKSIVGHIVGKKNKKYSNPVKIKLEKSKFTLKVGEKVKIKGKVILKNKKKKQLSNKHARRLRFKVADAKVAKVSKYGNVTAVSKGTTTVYVYARNGLAKEVKVTVK